MLSATYSELLSSNKYFRRLWTGQVISELGTWFSFIAELGMVRLFGGSAKATAALMVARLLPFLLVAPIAGVLADRRSRKQIMIVTDLLRAGVAVAFIAAGAMKSVPLVVLCSALVSSLTMFFDAAKSAAMPNLVTSRELLTANVLMYSTRFLQYTLGSALGGLAAAYFGYDMAFVINGLSFVASAAFIASIPASVMKSSGRESARAETETEMIAITRTEEGDLNAIDEIQETVHSQKHFLTDLREGLTYILATPFVRGLILVNIGWATGGGMVNILFDQLGGHTFAIGEGDRGDWAVATLLTASGAGLFAGMMLARRAGSWVAEPRRAGRFIGWSLLLQGIFFAASGVMPSLALMSVWVAASRLVLGMEFGVQETLLMRVLPDAYRGRVFTTDRSLELGTMSLSIIAAGWLLTWFSPRAMMVLAGALAASPGLAWLLALGFTNFRVPARAVSESYGD